MSSVSVGIRKQTLFSSLTDTIELNDIQYSNLDLRLWRFDKMLNCMNKCTCYKQHHDLIWIRMRSDSYSQWGISSLNLTACPGRSVLIHLCPTSCWDGDKFSVFHCFRLYTKAFRYYTQKETFRARAENDVQHTKPQANCLTLKMCDVLKSAGSHIRQH